jgi:GNAT superfamily N-acetyltransferase
VAGATLLETFVNLIPAADLVAHVTNKSSIAAFAGWIVDPGAAVFYAAAEGTDAPMGYAVLCAPEFPSELLRDSDMELRRIYTLGIAHGTGLGPALMEAAVAEARGRGHARLLLGVHPGNSRARSFYEREGFRVIGERTFTVGQSRFTDPVYALDL